MSAAPVITGRVYGYANEVDGFCRAIEKVCATIVAHKPNSNVRLVRVGAPLNLGTRGFFTKRALSQQEYEIHLDSPDQRQVFEVLLRDLTRRLS